MLAYRTDEDAARLVAEQLERETAELWRENVALATKLARMEMARDAALERLADAGPGGGRASARRDRIAVGALVLLVAALASLALLIQLACEVRWTLDARPDATILPVLGILGLPGMIAAGVGYPYRRRSLVCRLAFAVGAAVALTSVALIANLGAP